MRITHAPCGRSWHQAGGRSGHCGHCHETFYGITAFDAHYTLPEDNEPGLLCREPVEVEDKWWQDEDRQWHKGRRLTDEEKARLWPKK